jgi:type VI secretion system protein
MLRAPLLSRIEGSSRVSGEMDVNDYAGVVQQSLKVLLNAKRGSASIDEQYGLPDFNSASHHFADVIRHLEHSMWQTIHRYEPRLNHVKISGEKPTDQPDRILFTVKAKLKMPQGEQEVCYFTLLSDVGKVTIQR